MTSYDIIRVEKRILNVSAFKHMCALNISKQNIDLHVHNSNAVVFYLIISRLS